MYFLDGGYMFGGYLARRVIVRGVFVRRVFVLEPGQGAPSSRVGAPTQYNQVVQGNMQRNIVQTVKHVNVVNLDVSEKKVSTQSENVF